MTPETVHGVVRCGHLVDGVFEALRSITTGVASACTGAIVAAPATPLLADRWLRSLAARHGFAFIRVASDAPGAAWNAGLDTSADASFAICIDAGDVLAAGSLAQMRDALQRTPDAGFATPGVEWVGPGTSRSFTEPHGGTPSAILANTHAVHASSLFRVSLWKAGPKFDGALTALEHADLWSRIGRGAPGIPVPEACVRRRVHARALYKAHWGTPEYVEAAQTVFARHADAADAATVLCEKESRLNRGFERRSALAERAARLTAEHEMLLEQLKHERDRHPSAPQGLDLGSFQRTSPLAHDWGYSRGTPADRPLIERFLAAHRDDIRGRVLEVQEDDYTRRFGGPKVTTSDVLDVNAANTRATVFADLRDAGNIADEAFDCIILTQTLHFIDDMEAVVRECFRILRPGGTLLATLPCSSRVCLEYGPDHDYWRVTDGAVRALAARTFPPSAISSVAIGNPLVNAAFTFGLAGEDLPSEAWSDDDPYFPSIIGLRAIKPRRRGEPTRWHRAPARPIGLVLVYHRINRAEPDPFRLCVTPSQLRSQLEWLDAVGSIVPLRQLAAREHRGPSLQFAITFDDGYVDNLTNAAPLLSRSRAPATFFLTTAAGPEPYRYWWDRLCLLLSEEGPRLVALDLPSGRITLPLRSPAERATAVHHIREAVVHLPAAERDSVVDAAVVSAGAGQLGPDTRRMTWHEARRLAANPLFEVGAHTHHHLFLPAQSEDAVAAELEESRLTLERELGAAVTSLAYPFGAFDEETIQVAQKAGYRVAVTCRGRAVTSLDDPLALPRLAVTGGPLDIFVENIERLIGQRLR